MGCGSQYKRGRESIEGSIIPSNLFLQKFNNLICFLLVLVRMTQSQLLGNGGDMKNGEGNRKRLKIFDNSDLIKSYSKTLIGRYMNPMEKDVKGTSSWFQVYERFGSRKEERPFLSLETVFGVGVFIFGLSNTLAKDMVSGNGYWVCGSLYFYNKFTFCVGIAVGMFWIKGQLRVSLYLAVYIMGANP